MVKLDTEKIAWRIFPDELSGDAGSLQNPTDEHEDENCAARQDRKFFLFWKIVKNEAKIHNISRFCTKVNFMKLI